MSVDTGTRIVRLTPEVLAELDRHAPGCPGVLTSAAVGVPVGPPDPVSWRHVECGQASAGGPHHPPAQCGHCGRWSGNWHAVSGRGER